MSRPSNTPVDFPAGAGPLPEIPGVEVEHEFHQLPAGRFHVARIGDRSLPAIMLVHGFPQHWWGWRGVIAELSKEAHLIVPDLRGHGWSAVPTAPGSYLKRELAADLRGLLDAMDIDQIAIAAHDWGGFASQLLALDTPERVSRLLAISIPPVIPVKRPPLRSMLRTYYQLVFSAPFSDRFLRHFQGRFAKSLRQDVQRRDVFTDADARAFAALYTDPTRAKAAQMIYRSFIGGDAKEIFTGLRGARFQMPVRFVLSAYDAYIPPEFAEVAPRTGEHVEAIVQDRTGHFAPDEDPQYVADQIREWLLPYAKPISG